jgi:hypothetical protein
VGHKRTVTLRNTLTKVKDPTDTKTRIGTVYKVTCAECSATYIGETGRILHCRIKEHERSTEKKDVANRIAAHHMETNHRIDWEGATYMEFIVFEDERMFLGRFSSPRTKLLAARCECMHLIKMNCLAL